MKICIFSDVHGNIEALSKMLVQEANEVDLFIFAGDIFGYFYGQREIIDRFSSMSNLVEIKGNHDKNYLASKKLDKFTDRYGSSYKISLTDKQYKYINDLPDKAEIMIEGKHFGIFHGGPSEYLEQRLYPDSIEEINQIAKEINYDYLIIGHTHYQFLYETNRKVIINPGSLGQPRDGKGFSYCLLDTSTGSCIFKSVDVEITTLLRSVEENDADRYVFEYLKNKYN